jgi:hypothetical protein
MKIAWKKPTIGLAAAVAVAAVVLGTATACSSGNVGQQVENSQQQEDQAALEASQPLPYFNWSQYRQTLIDAETAEANNTQTTSFMFQMGTPNPVASCPSIGEPVANTASLSNPQQAVGVGNSGTTISQMDPNGVYTPTNSTGTYVICLANGGSKYLFYWEGDVMTVAGAAEWNSQTHSVQVIGAPTAAVHTVPSAKASARK